MIGASGEPGAKTRGRAKRRRAGVALLLAGAALSLAACGGPASANGDWSGTIELEGSEGEEGGVELFLSLDESASGIVSGRGSVVVDDAGDRTERELSSVSGEVEEDGTLRLSATDEGLLSEAVVNLGGKVGGNRMQGEARLEAGSLLADTGLFGEAETFEGDFELRREGE
jgi:hypothetical protein